MWASMSKHILAQNTGELTLACSLPKVSIRAEGRAGDCKGSLSAAQVCNRG